MKPKRKKKTKPDIDRGNRWKPRRRGTIYCSPACGGGCTWAAYQTAVKAADKLAAKLATRMGLDWKPCVWENLGWHWSVVCQGGPAQAGEHLAEIRRREGRGYWADLRPAGRQWHANGRTPEEAFDAALTEAYEHKIRLHEDIMRLGGIKK